MGQGKAPGTHTAGDKHAAPKVRCRAVQTQTYPQQITLKDKDRRQTPVCLLTGVCAQKHTRGSRRTMADTAHSRQTFSKSAAESLQACLTHGVAISPLLPVSYTWRHAHKQFSQPPTRRQVTSPAVTAPTRPVSHTYTNTDFGHSLCGADTGVGDDSYDGDSPFTKSRR